MNTLTEPFEIVCEDTSLLERDAWLLERRKGICSTDAAVASNVSHWKSRYTGWAEKSGLLEDEEDKDRFIMGRVFEEPLMRLWSMRYGTPWDSIQRHLMVRSREHPWMLGNPDGLTDDAVIEVKTAHWMDEARWEFEVPTPYRFQAQHMMHVTGRRTCIFVVAFGWQYPDEVVIEWDDEIDEPMMVIEEDFWRRVLENDPPDVDESDSTRKTLREQWFKVELGKTVDLPVEALTEIEQRELSRAAIKPHEARAKLADARLKKWLEDAENGRVNGTIVVTNRADVNGNRRLYFPERAA